MAAKGFPYHINQVVRNMYKRTNVCGDESIMQYVADSLYTLYTDAIMEKLN